MPRKPTSTRPAVVLASGSPRRIELLTQAGLAPQVLVPNVDELMHPRENPGAMVARLAREKAEAVAARVVGQSDDRTLIIAADTTVVAPDGKRVLGKPSGPAEARRMLALLSGRTHTVLTGYCVLELRPASARAGLRKLQSHVLVRVVRSRVRMRKLSTRDIAGYVSTGEPLDKAGSYGAQGLGMSLIESITGSYANVVGLPMCQLLQDLEERFAMPLFQGTPTKRAGRRR